MRYHLTPVGMEKSHKTGNHKCWRGCGQTGSLLQCRWECELVQPLRKTVWMEVPQRVKNRSSLWPSLCTAGDSPQSCRCGEMRGHMHPAVYGSNVHSRQTVEGARGPSRDEGIKKMWSTATTELFLSHERRQIPTI